MTTTTSTAPIVGSATSTPHELPERCTIPWSTGLRLGCGIDSISATAAPSPFVPLEAEIVHQPEESIFVSVARDLDASLRAAFAVRDNPLPALGHLGLRAWSIAKALAFSEPFKPSVTLLIWWERVADIVRPSPTSPLSMTADAQAVYRASPTRFRERFGDYYVSGAKSGSRFAAILSISYDEGDALKARIDELLHSTKPLHEVKSVLEDILVSPVVQSIDACVYTLLDASEPKSLETFSFSAGDSDSSPFSACIARLRTMSVTSVDHILAELAHYSTHSGLSTLSRAIPLADKVRDDQWKMRAAIEECLIRGTGIPERIAQQPEVLALRDRVTNGVQWYIEVNRVVIDLQVADYILSLLNGHVQDLKEFLGVYDIWARLALATFRKPTTSIGQRWTHGMTKSDQYLQVEDHCLEDSTDARPFSTRFRRRLLFYNSELTRVSAPPGTHIVGWTVKALEPDVGDGDWETFSGSRLLQPAVRFRMVPGRTRTRWEFTIHCARHKFLDALAECYREDLEQWSNPFSFSYHRSASLL